MWREYGNRFFKYEILFFELGVAFLQFLDLFCSKDFAIINFDGGILFNPFANGRCGDAVFFAGLGLGFAVLLKRDQRFSLKKVGDINLT